MSSSSWLAAGLKRVAVAARGGSFSAELSPGELGLCTDLGARPLAQVFGACAYMVGVSGVPVLGDPGYREYFGRGRRGGPAMFELRRVSSAYNDARRTALARMREQATEAGAHLVVAVDVGLTERESGDVQIIEYVVSGTAVRLQDTPSTTEPHLCALSMTDCWCLRQAGYDVVGLAAATTVYYARPSSVSSRALGKRRRSAPPNQELPDLSVATTAARDACQARMEDQAKRQGGTGMVGMALELSHSLGLGLKDGGTSARNQRYANLHLTVHGLGSVIRPAQRAEASRDEPKPRPVLWLR